MRSPKANAGTPCPARPDTRRRASPAEGEDPEGRKASAQLVDQGITEAERDQVLQAAKSADKQDRLER